MLNFTRRFSSNKLGNSPYFAITESIEKFNLKYKHRDNLLPDPSVQAKLGGRIIGRRKASATLIFLDLESNGSKV